MVTVTGMRHYPVYLYCGLPCLYLFLAVTKANFGWDGNDLVWRVGVAVSFLPASFLCKRILDSTPCGAKKKYGKALAALIALPIVIHVLGITIINSAPGIGSSL